MFFIFIEFLKSFETDDAVKYEARAKQLENCKRMHNETLTQFAVRFEKAVRESAAVGDEYNNRALAERFLRQCGLESSDKKSFRNHWVMNKKRWRPEYNELKVALINAYPNLGVAIGEYDPFMGQLEHSKDNLHTLKSDDEMHDGHGETKNMYLYKGHKGAAAAAA